MTATPQDVLAKLAALKVELEDTTSSGAKMVAAHGTDWTTWPLGHWANAAALHEEIMAEVAQLVAPAPEPTPTPTPAGSGLALIAYGGTLSKRPHISDGSKTYDVVVGGWSDAPLLAKVDGKGFAYTVTTAGVVPGQYVILDPLGNSGMAGSYAPDAYIQKCAELKAANPGLHGIFLDNNVALGKILVPTVPEATLKDVYAHVSAGLKSHGLAWLSNTGGYISGDSRDNTGALWRYWAQECSPYFEYLLLENWQQTPGGVTPNTRRLKGIDAWYKHWDDWQLCVGAVPGQFIAACYERGGDLMFGTYGRASMLTAPGADPRNVFYAAVNNQTDPYGQPWQKTNPAPKVDAVAGTATL